jgi:hypothetical protein
LFAVANSEFEIRQVRLDQNAVVGLKVMIVASGFKADVLELSRNVVGRGIEPRRRDTAAFQLIGRQIRDVLA